MDKEMVSGDLALENVLIMAERIAFLHYSFVKTLEDEFSEEEAKRLTLKAIDEYGRLTANSATEKIEAQGLDLTLANYRYGKDLPSVGWKAVPIEMPEDKPDGKISKIVSCPLAVAWQKLGEDGRRIGRLYCWIDQMKYKAYGKGYRCFHDKNVLDGDDCCIVRVEQGVAEDRDKVR
ncbi:MAG: L-2-amino-thiazoline-4-carboxylic acid hydrolase [Synergistaceae bacterium]|jgi:hypothetical protein|nr:L-2-amino-thiazoline-4-carboxylic acid hydrolase [Synergistaceae bacterium]